MHSALQLKLYPFNNSIDQEILNFFELQSKSSSKSLSYIVYFLNHIINMQIFN